jgi:hypothetical protein
LAVACRIIEGGCAIGCCRIIETDDVVVDKGCDVMEDGDDIADNDAVVDVLVVLVVFDVVGEDDDDEDEDGDEEVTVTGFVSRGSIGTSAYFWGVW